MHENHDPPYLCAFEAEHCFVVVCRRLKVASFESVDTGNRAHSLTRSSRMGPHSPLPPVPSAEVIAMGVPLITDLIDKAKMEGEEVGKVTVRRSLHFANKKQVHTGIMFRAFLGTCAANLDKFPFRLA